uniref:Uncharacterized protein n=1 Tax=Arundo donax TaxID=35708 RepID=A0A0A9AM24_ARUDO
MVRVGYRPIFLTIAYLNSAKYKIICVAVFLGHT